MRALVLRGCVLMALLLLSGCLDDKTLFPLSTPRVPYSGNELRIDGYYYSTPSSANDVGIAVFYRDGVCLHNFTRIQSQETFAFIENDFLRNTPLMSRLWSTPTHVGVFHVQQDSLEFETWEATYDITTFTHLCRIIDDTTFVLTKRVNNAIDKAFSEQLTYRFKQFDSKPDSTNSFIK